MFEEITYFMVFDIPLIVYGGVVTLLFFLVTASLPILNQRGVYRMSVKWHTRMAKTSIALAIVHGLLGILTYL